MTEGALLPGGAARRWWSTLFPLGFAARLGLATSLLIVIVCILQSWILARYHLEHIRAYLTDRGRSISEYLAREAGSGRLAGNLAGWRQLAEEARAQSGVVYARFFDRQGLLLVSVGHPPGNPPPLQATVAQDASGPIPVGDDLWEFQAPIVTTGPRGSREPGARQDGPARSAPAQVPQHLGTVAVGISLEPVLALRRRMLATAALFTSLFLLVAVLGAALLARAITRPLQTLATAADRLSGGDFDAKVDVRTRDEVGGLARSFNAMVESLARSRATLEEKVLELEQANRLKSEFLATVSHELRTPLNVILGYAEILAEGAAGTVSIEQAEMLAAIQRYSKLQLDLITNVLDFTRLSSGKVSFQVERFELAPLFAEIETLYRARLASPRVVLTVSVDPRVPELETDRIKLQEIVRNLVDNAVKFTEEGAIMVRVEPGAAPGSVAIEVADTGVGIQAADVPSIFQPFYQSGQSSTRRTGGVGLGLSIVRQLAEDLGGSVSVVSRAGAGSTFRVEVPCVLDSSAAPGEASLTAVDALDAIARNAGALPERSHPIRSSGRKSPGASPAHTKS